MSSLKVIFDWISNRKLLSIFYALLFLGVVITAGVLINAYSGQLSEPVKRGKIIDAVYAYGTVTSDRRFSFSPRIGQDIDKIFFKEGDIVKKDMPLLQTNDRVVIRAPFSGIIHLLPYKVRENTYAKEPRIILVDISDRYISVTLQSEVAARVKIGQEVRYTFTSEKYFSGKVSGITMKGNSFLVKVSTTDLPEFILPGATCNVDILIGERDNALLIPLQSLSNGYVWVKRGNRIPRKIRVGLGVTDKHWAEVKSGDIQEGDRLKLPPLERAPRY